MSKIIVIVGPTASGKTALSIHLAKKYNAVVINADSTQVYIEPKIATAKITEEEKENIPHYLFDIVSLNDDYTLYNYQKDARKLLDKLIEENKNIVIVGGTGLYIKALLYNYELTETKQERIDLSSYSNEELKQIADDIDTENNIHINNRQRLERYISYYKLTGKTITKTDKINEPLYKFIMIGLKPDREELYNMIDKRVDSMVSSGLLEEAKNLYQKKYKNYKNIIGYKELISYFENKNDLNESLNLIKQNTRHYAKRQFTWFNNQMKDIIWFKVNYNDFNITINEIEKHLEK